MKMKKTLLIIFTVLSCFANAQNANDIIANLKKELATNPDAKKRASIYSDLTWYYSNIATDSAIIYGNKAIQESKKLQDSVILAQVYSDLGAVYYRKSDYKTAKANYLTAYQIRKNRNDITGMARAAVNLANIYNKENKKTLALKSYLEAIDYFEKTNNFGIVAMTNANIGSLFLELKNYSKSMSYTKKAIQYQEENHIETDLTTSYLTMGNIYLKLKDTINALQFYNKSIVSSKKTGNNLALSAAFNNISSIKIEQKKQIEANKLIEKSSSMLKKLKANNNESALALNLVSKTISEKKYFEAQKILLKLKHQYSKNDLYKSELWQTYIFLVQTHSYLNRPDSATYYIKASMKLQDAIIEKTVQKQTSELETEYQTEKKEKDLLKTKNKLFQKEVALQKEKLDVQAKKNTIITILILVGLLILLSYGIYRKKQLEQKAFLAAEQTKQRQILTQAVIEAEESERKRIASDLHDGVGQLFSAVKMNLSGLLNRMDITKDDDRFLAEKTMALVDESCKEVRVISHKMMPNFLLKSGIAADIKSFIEKIDENSLKITFESEGFKEQLEFNEEIILYRVIQELINNVIKHANADELQIYLNKTNENIQVKIIDNGVGFDYNKAIEKGGLGLKNILVRIKYLKGTVQFLSNSPTGTKVQIEIPLS
jgi:two-component system, NarL family, sensor kinase